MQVCDRLALLASMLVNFNHRWPAPSVRLSSHLDQWFDGGQWRWEARRGDPSRGHHQPTALALPEALPEASAILKGSVQSLQLHTALGAFCWPTGRRMRSYMAVGSTSRNSGRQIIASQLVIIGCAGVALPPSTLALKSSIDVTLEQTSEAFYRAASPPPSPSDVGSVFLCSRSTRVSSIAACPPVSFPTLVCVLVVFTFLPRP